MSRGESAVREHAMRGPEPRAPELDIPRLLGAGVGALSSSLVFERARRLRALRGAPRARRLRALGAGRFTARLGGLGLPRLRARPNRAAAPGRGAVSMEAGKAPGNPWAGLGVRIFKLKTSKSVRGKLKELYNMLTSFIRLVEIPKSALRYREEWENSFLQTVHSRLATGKWLRPKRKKKKREKKVKRKSGKPIPKRPPFLLTVRFVLTTNEQRGRTDAPVVVDLRKRELRVPCVGVTIPLPERLVKALEEENRLEPRPDFVVQLTSSGALRIIAKRAPKPRALETPLRIIAVDENSRYGFVLAAFDFDSSGYCRLVHFEIFQTTKPRMAREGDFSAEELRGQARA